MVIQTPPVHSKCISESDPNRVLRGFFLGLLFLWTLACPAGVRGAEKSVLSVQAIKELVPAIEAAEASGFSHITLESETWLEAKVVSPDGGEKWVRTPISATCDVWFEGRPAGKARVNVRKRILEWREGAAPYLELSYSVGFDGQHGRVVHYTSGPAGDVSSVEEADIVSGYPDLLRQGFRDFTGAAFSLRFFFADEEGPSQRTFSRFFQFATSAEGVQSKAFEIGVEKFQELDCIKLGSGQQKWGSETWWFDPARGFALVGHRKTNIKEDGKERLLAFTKVTKLLEVAPGIWWPVEASTESEPLGPGKAYMRLMYRASNVVANGPLEENSFTVPIPRGYLVNDKVKDTTYRVDQE